MATPLNNIPLGARPEGTDNCRMAEWPPLFPVSHSLYNNGMNLLAKELNSQLDGTVAFRLLSQTGRRFYLPRGIIAQSAEAKNLAHTANATIGMAFNQGKPFILPAVEECMPTLTTEQIVCYAPPAGLEEFRKMWQNLILQKNPSLKPEMISLPVVTTGLTGGLSALSELFIGEDSTIIISEPSWDSYSLIFETRQEGKIRGFSFLGDGPGLDMDAISRAVREEAAKGFVRILFNFPNNPAGYSPANAEAKALTELLLEAAESGADVLALCDDAYYGHSYEDDVFEESIFSPLANLHERILAVKIDGPIKEDYVWGFRVGCVTFGSRGLGPEQYNALTTKLTGTVRAAVSSSNTPGQYIVMKAMIDERTPKEKAAYKELLKKRYNDIKKFLSENPEHPHLKPLPFNSGYFMCFRCEGITAEALRKELLFNHGIGVVALGESCLRIAYSILEDEQIPMVYRAIYDCALKLGKL